MTEKTLSIFVLTFFAFCISGGSGLCSFFEAGSMAQAVTDPPPESSILRFDNVSNAYPAHDPDPADSKPMVAPEEKQDEKAQKPVAELPREVCPLLHDRSLFRAYARYEREQSFRRLDVRDGNAIVYHSSDVWSRVSRAGGGIKLLSAARDPNSGKWIARVFFSKEYLCGDGIFEVEVDDWLTPEIPVLAIADNVMLISAAGQLAYMQTEDAPKLRWRTVWDTDISIEYEHERPIGSAPLPNNQKPAPRKKINKSPQFRGNR